MNIDHWFQNIYGNILSSLSGFVSNYSFYLVWATVGLAILLFLLYTWRFWRLLLPFITFLLCFPFVLVYFVLGLVCEFFVACSLPRVEHRNSELEPLLPSYNVQNRPTGRQIDSVPACNLGKTSKLKKLRQISVPSEITCCIVQTLIDLQLHMESVTSPDISQFEIFISQFCKVYGLLDSVNHIPTLPKLAQPVPMFGNSFRVGLNFIRNSFQHFSYIHKIMPENHQKFLLWKLETQISVKQFARVKTALKDGFFINFNFSNNGLLKGIAKMSWLNYRSLVFSMITSLQQREGYRYLKNANKFIK